MFSWIQYHILLELTRHSTRRYSQLRPPDVEGNLFMYHLKGLIKEGLVQKVDGEYGLTVKGLQYVGTLSLATGKTRQQPKILTAIICQNEVGEYLFSRWHRQPNLGQISFPHGMMHYGESLYDAPARELAEKAGLKAELSHKGEIYIRGFRGDEIDRHMLVHLFVATHHQAGRESEFRPDISEPFWASLDSMQPSDFIPGFYELARLVDENTSISPLFHELTVAI